MPNADAYLLSPDDNRLLKEFCARLRDEKINPRLRPYHEEYLGSEPTVAVALTPTAGIPAMTESGTGTGSGVDDPSYADCKIFRNTRTGALTELVWLGFSRTVYNLSRTAVPGSKYVTIHRSPDGYWYVPVNAIEGTGGGGGGTGITSFSGARITRTTRLTVPTNTTTVITCDSETYDTDNYHDTSSSTGRLTAPVDGYYGLEASCTWHYTSSVTSPTFHLWLRKNGNTALRIASTNFAASALENPFTQHVQDKVFLSAGDYVEPCVYCANTSISQELYTTSDFAGGTGPGGDTPCATIERLPGK